MNPTATPDPSATDEVAAAVLDVADLEREVLLSVVDDAAAAAILPEAAADLLAEAALAAEALDSDSWLWSIDRGLPPLTATPGTVLVGVGPSTTRLELAGGALVVVGSTWLSSDAPWLAFVGCGPSTPPTFVSVYGGSKSPPSASGKHVAQAGCRLVRLVGMARSGSHGLTRKGLAVAASCSFG